MTCRSFAVKIPPQLGDRLVARAQMLGTTEAELIQRAIAIYLESDSPNTSPKEWQQQVERRLQALEDRLFPPLPAPSAPADDQSPEPDRVLPTIRQLRVGDIVQIRDSDSAHYLAQVPLIKVSLIRATVRTDDGEQSFLKRDLRFICGGEAPEIAP
ncbi:MAG: hypothetical protein HC919_04055 [Oscillatoriales cyanobacterium SM2_2_1]|nr:hypothetical protein [Oscillatoriales cyanobacterium SM2_2_1]